MTDFIQVITTTQHQEQAERIAREIVTRRLAACAQVDGPVTSVYWWQGAVESAIEWRCTLKTRAALFADVCSAVREIHPYEVPEIISTRIDEAHAAYLDWMHAALRSQGG